MKKRLLFVCLLLGFFSLSMAMIDPVESMIYETTSLKKVKSANDLERGVHHRSLQESGQNAFVRSPQQCAELLFPRPILKKNKEKSYLPFYQLGSQEEKQDDSCCIKKDSCCMCCGAASLVAFALWINKKIMVDGVLGAPEEL